jgi:hypothetical protein
MRTRHVALAGALLAGVAALSGCARLEHPTANEPKTATPAPVGAGEFEKAPTPSASPTPPSKAGGTCTLLDYASVQAATGTEFQVAAASSNSGAKACALQVLYSDYPSLVLSVIGTQADAKAFDKAAPSDSDDVSKLGSAAYSRILAAGDGAGPAVEIAWLGKHQQIVTLRYTYPQDVGAHTARENVGKLTDYARTLEAKR